MQTESGLIAALTEPAKGRHEQFVSHLRESSVFRDYQEAFETTTGLPLTLRAAGSLNPPLHGSKKVNVFCALMAARGKTCAACLQLQQQVEDGASHAPKTLECFAGLSDSAVPVRVGQSLIGFLQTGQVALRPPSNAHFSKFVRELTASGTSDDASKLETAYFRTRTTAKRQYDSVLRLLAIFADQLAGLSHGLTVGVATAGAPNIAKARCFIQENLSEDLPLARVAQVANLSPTHFCKMFRRETGVKFIEYLAHQRTEHVKRQLLNPHVRVSEAAFAAGFQSLSQFNRVFRRIAGDTPRAYRERLHDLQPRENKPAALGHAA